MSKLIVKQELPPPSVQERLIGVLQVILPIIVLIIAIAAAVSLYFTSETDNLGQEQANLPALPLAKLPNAYLTQERELNSLIATFENTVKTQAESYAKNVALVKKAEAVLSHVNAMDTLVSTLTLDEQDKQTLLTRHQYQKDYWESKLAFHRLRMARFTADTLTPIAVDTTVSSPTPGVETAFTEPSPAPASVPETSATPAEAGMAPSAAEQQPAGSDKTALPPDVQLPPGMCPLFGPGAAECKAGKH